MKKIVGMIFEYLIKFLIRLIVMTLIQYLLTFKPIRIIFNTVLICTCSALILQGTYDYFILAPIRKKKELKYAQEMAKIYEAKQQTIPINLKDQYIKTTNVICEHDCPEIEMVLIDGSVFMMNKDYPYPVTMNSFYMSKSEVTVGQYQKCIDAGVCERSNHSISKENCNLEYQDRNQHPINCINWQEARRFAKWMGGDLPSESQWEYAARSQGKDIDYPWGNEEPTCEHAVITNLKMDDKGAVICKHQQTSEVCSKAKGNTEQGLCDMTGNVWEWTLDVWDNSYRRPSDGKASCDHRECDFNSMSYHVFRGGSWRNAIDVRERTAESTLNQNNEIGFRFVKTINPPTPNAPPQH